MHWFTQLFMLLVLLGTALRAWLNQRQVVAVCRHRDRVPEAFAARIQLESHRKAADYTVARARLGRWAMLFDTAVLLLLTLGGGIDAIDRAWELTGWSPLWQGAAVILSIILLTSLLELPFSLYGTFGIETRFGFNRITPRLFISDLIKGLLLSLALGLPLLVVVLLLMAKAGSAWWWYTWLVFSAFSIFIQWLWPVAIAPLFNKFTPLADESLKQRLEALLQRCGFASKGVFVMDGSTRSAHSNAYFTGFGRNKRIVFFDTLITPPQPGEASPLQPAEVEAVLAHELGHFKLHHIRVGVVLSLASSLLALALLGKLAAWPMFYQALGVSHASNHAALLLFMLAMPVFTFFITPLAAWWSRRHEFQADEFAADFADAADLAAALVKLNRDNGSTLTPDPLHSAFYDSHPPTPIRIARLQQLAAART
jgi:STE24 endopeptidase